MWEFILNKFYEPVIGFIKSQWKGLAIGIIVPFLFGLYFWGDIFNATGSLGHKIGTYKIKIGEHKRIADRELSISFHSQLYIPGKNDSILVFPYIGIGQYMESYPYQDFRYDYRKNFPLKEKFYFDCKYYYYCIELIEIKYTNNDTLAVFNVYRKEFPEVIGQDSGN